MLLGLAGFKGSGKDTACELLRQTIPPTAGGVERRAFADDMKLFGARLLGLEGTDRHLLAEMNAFKERGTLSVGLAAADPLSCTGRRFLQTLGRAGRDMFGDDFWVDRVVPLDRLAFERAWGIGIGAPGPTPVGGEWRQARYLGVVTDVRYPNEAERISRLGGQMWEIVRPGLVCDGDPSEQPLPRHLVDRVITNDGTVGDLRVKIEAEFGRSDLWR